ncbi:hypothetical protein [Paraburkholderia sp. GAS334]|uniref:hypothetical protein n=1 Tax=Paraburkholderia sp. GAS334 TaxID=3035131 RepID=UPI003D1BC43F
MITRTSEAVLILRVSRAACRTHEKTPRVLIPWRFFLSLALRTRTPGLQGRARLT